MLKKNTIYGGKLWVSTKIAINVIIKRQKDRL